MHPFARPGSASTRLPSVAGALLAAVVLLLTVAQAATAAGPAPFAGGSPTPPTSCGSACSA